MQSTVPTPLVSVDADHPWLGLAAFTEDTQRFFFGRDAEISEIFVRVRDNTLTILYGQSGLGKSSLLGAGLLPKLQVEDYRPVEIRLRYHDGAPPLIDQLFSELKKAHLLGPERPANLWEWLHCRESRLSEYETRPPVLIFDQFEEIFTLGQRSERVEETRELFTQLAELIENRTPAALRTRFQEDRRLARHFDNTPTPARIVITLREDFLSHLEQWKKVLPSLMKNRMALDLLNGPKALEAVVRPGHLEGRNLVDEEVGAAIVRFVAGRKGDVPLEEIGAVPPLLSLVCDELNRLRIAEGLFSITANLVESQSADILKSFYAESFSELPPAVRHYIEGSLVTKEGGYRSPVAQEDALATLRRAGVEDPSAALAQLIKRRLITPEERGGVVWLEITHDVLAPEVVRSRDEHFENERAAGAEKKLAEERALARKRRNRSLLILAFSVTFIAIALFLLLDARAARTAVEGANTQFNNLTKQVYRDLQTEASKRPSPINKDGGTSDISNTTDLNSPIPPDGNGTTVTKPSSLSPLPNDPEQKGPTAESVSNRTPVFQTPRPGSILSDLGLKNVSGESIRPVMNNLAGADSFDPLKLLATFYMIQGSNFKDEEKIDDAIKSLTYSIAFGEKCLRAAAGSDDLEETELVVTRYKSRLADLYFQRGKPEDLEKAIQITNACLTDAVEQGAKWHKTTERRFYYYKTRLARALAVKNPPASAQWNDASRLLMEGIVHKRKELELQKNVSKYDADQNLAGVLASSAEIARSEIKDFPLAAMLYRESLELQSKPAPGREIDTTLQMAMISKSWFLAQSLLAADPHSDELVTLTNDAIQRCEWVARHEPEKADPYNAITNIGTFQTTQMLFYLHTSRFDNARNICGKAIENFTRALELRLKSETTNPDAGWLVNQQQLFAWAIHTYWMELKLDESKDSGEKIREMDLQVRELVLKELRNQLGEVFLSTQAATVHERSYLLALKLADAGLTMDSARSAAAIYLNHAEQFRQITPRARAWGFGGASTATKVMAEVLRGTPAGYKTSMMDEEDQLQMQEMALNQAEIAVEASLAEQGSPDLYWIIVKYNSAYASFADFLGNSPSAAQDRRKLAKRKFDMMKKIYATVPSAADALEWAGSSNGLLQAYWLPKPVDLDEAELIARNTSDELERRNPPFSQEFPYRIAKLNARQSLATMLAYQYDSTPPGTRRTSLAEETVRIWQDAMKRAEEILRTEAEAGNQDNIKMSRAYIKQGFDAMIAFYQKLDLPKEQMADLEKQRLENEANIK